MVDVFVFDINSSTKEKSEDKECTKSLLERQMDIQKNEKDSVSQISPTILDARVYGNFPKISFPNNSKTVTYTVCEATEKDLVIGDGPCDLSEKQNEIHERENLFKEVSVQTSREKLIAGNLNSMCVFEKEHFKRLEALCLEYPPYKKRKMMNLDMIIKNVLYNNSDISDLHFANGASEKIQNKAEYIEERIAPQNYSGTKMTTGLYNSVSLNRSIRLGLSKRAKPRSLHQKVKLPTEEKGYQLKNYPIKN